MGCGPSGVAANRGPSQDQRQPRQTKTVLLLFYLPGSVRDLLTRILDSEEITSHLRFVDMPNHRGSRRYWVKDLSGKKDYHGMLYLADLRDHPTLLLTTRTCNWFLRNVAGNFDAKLIAFYSKEEQLEEFKGYLPKDFEMLAVQENSAESAKQLAEYLQRIEQKADQRPSYARGNKPRAP